MKAILSAAQRTTFGQAEWSGAWSRSERSMGDVGVGSRCEGVG